MRTPEDHQFNKLLEPLATELRSIATRLDQIRAQQESSNRDQQQATNEANNRAIAAITSLQTIRAHTEANYSQQQHAGPNPWLNFAVQCALCLFTAGAFVAAGYYAWIANQQKDTMVRQFNVMADTFHESQMESDAIQLTADATKSAADTATKALTNQQQAFVIDQRPYIIAERPVFNNSSLVPLQGITANITFKNVGKTPAVKVISNVDMISFHPTDRDALIAFVGEHFDTLKAEDRNGRREMREMSRLDIGHDIAPAGTYFITNQPALVLNARELKTLLLDEQVPTGSIVIFFIGIVSYTDAFSKPYETQVCWFYFGSNINMWHICDSHNLIR
jgi:hypothetical protein